MNLIQIRLRETPSIVEWVWREREKEKRCFLGLENQTRSSKFAGASSRQVHPRPRSYDSRWIRVEERHLWLFDCDQTGDAIGVQTVGDVWYGTHGLVTNVTPEKRRTRVINPSCVINFTPVIIYPSLHRALEVVAWSRDKGTGPGLHIRCAGPGSERFPTVVSERSPSIRGSNHSRILDICTGYQSSYPFAWC